MGIVLIHIDPHPYLWRFIFLGSLFTFIAAATFLLFTGRGRRPELGTQRLSNWAALAIVLPPWLIALAWRYHAEFGGRFYALRTDGSGSFTAEYVYPARTVAFDGDDVAAWRGPVEWSEKFPGRRVEIELIDGEVHRSSHLKGGDFAQLKERLAEYGVTFEHFPKHL